MLGYTLYSMLYGAEHTASFALVDLGQVLFVFTLYKILLALDARDGVSGRVPLIDSLLIPSGRNSAPFWVEYPSNGPVHPGFWGLPQ